MHYYLLVLTLRGGQNSGLEQGWMGRMYWIQWRLASFAVSEAEMAVLSFAVLDLLCFKLLSVFFGDRDGRHCGEKPAAMQYTLYFAEA